MESARRGTKRPAVDDPNPESTKKTKQMINRFMKIPSDLRLAFILVMRLRTIKMLCNLDGTMADWCREMDIENRWVRRQSLPNSDAELMTDEDDPHGLLLYLDFLDLVALEQADPVFERISVERHFRHYWLQENVGLENLKGGPYSKNRKLDRHEAAAEWVVWQTLQTLSLIHI